MKKLPSMATTVMDLTGTNKKEASRSLWWGLIRQVLTAHK